MTVDWQPTATRQALAARAALLQQVRDFFADRAVLEVETPALAAAAATDPQIHSLQCIGPDAQSLGWLQTSPEYAMKRLLAAGSGDIWQLCHVFRADEDSRLHNREFTLVEWYRLGFTLPQLMAETVALTQLLLGRPSAAAFQTLSYCQAFIHSLGFDPLQASQQQLLDVARHHGLQGDLATATRDELLDFLVATVIGPTLGRDGQLTCLHHYPASQAALAQLDPADPHTALRFELYCEGIELANGYVELGDAALQAQRFAADAAERQRRGLTVHTGDERLVAALNAGLPQCAGVALGFDRVVMLALGASHLQDVMAFTAARA
ncbi:MAG: EF-P lysine aminoacylase EpmA [Proteobacteria bacterium]|nr:EF-P lysine aminoacylase EpmA [Pseudomonadota bacterium]